MQMQLFLLGLGVALRQAPVRATATPAHLALQELPYVLPSFPHTGL